MRDAAAGSTVDSSGDKRTDAINEEIDMPTVTNAKLTLTESGGIVTVKVEYDARFTPIERQLTTLGLSYHSHVTVHGVDGDTVGGPLINVNFPRHNFDDDVTVGTTDLPITGIVEQQDFPRSSLQEDPFGDPDELECLIRIHSPLPLQFSDDVFTPKKILTSS